MAVSNSSLDAGLIKKANAPALMAFARIDGSSRLVRKITRVDGEIFRNRVCVSRPSIPGIHISSTATRGWCASAWLKNAWGSSKVVASQPAERTSRPVALSTDGSSSRRQTGNRCFREGAGLPLPPDSW